MSIKNFMTVKLVKAEEMTREEYCKSRGWELPENEKELANEIVYRVTYPDGYVSMCPKDIFLQQAYEIEGNKISQELVDHFIKNYSFRKEKIYGKINTIMDYELMNGWTGALTTTSVDESNYSLEIGKEILQKQLEDKIWFGLGFALGMAKTKRDA